ncbi:alpha-hydroxy acid oxidase [Falsiroseomonas sp.]|uniref:alpha-hydroxy acid oxidase n=1 Tax=Falsiroseomonas sp. TaxID=2870721 RepID=UPI00356219AE
MVLSNHGGRQLDSAVAGLDSLPEARRIVGDRLTILVDGGIRRGADVLKALALGADAVQIGRAALYGVAAAGQEGVTRSIEILRDDMHRALGLLGVASLAELGPELLAR